MNRINMINVLIEGMTENYGGKETFIINTFRKFRYNDFQFTFIKYVPEIAYENEIIDYGGKIVRITSRNTNCFKHIKDLKELLSDNSFDCIWSHKTTLSSCELIYLSKLANIPIRMIHAHTSSNMGNRLTYYLHLINRYFACNSSTHLLACSRNASTWFYSHRKSIIVPNGINTSIFKYDKAAGEVIREKYGLDKCYVIGHVGRFGPEKNHRKILGIFSKFQELVPNSRLLLCGDGPDRSAIESLAEEMNIRSKVCITGTVQNVNKVLSAFDTFIMPSLFEGLPFSLVEAQANGVKCFISDSISKESIMTDLVTRIPLKESNSYWADLIHKYYKSYGNESETRRVLYANEVKEKGFDIDKSLDRIQIIFEDSLS